LISDSFPVLLQSLDKINFRANSIYNVREGGQVQPLLVPAGTPMEHTDAARSGAKQIRYTKI